MAWAEELIEPARVADHPRLAFLYVVASWYYMTGRIEAAVRYCEAGQIVLGRSRDAPTYGVEGVLGAVYVAIGQPERLAELCRAQLARRRDTHVYIRAFLVFALALAGSGGEAMDWADGLIEVRKPRATRTCSRRPSLPTVRLSVTQIPSGRLTPWAGVW